MLKKDIKMLLKQCLNQKSESAMLHQTKVL